VGTVCAAIIHITTRNKPTPSKRTGACVSRNLCDKNIPITEKKSLLLAVGGYIIACQGELPIWVC